jgi:hypothetical protein
MRYALFVCSDESAELSEEQVQEQLEAFVYVDRDQFVTRRALSAHASNDQSWATAGCGTATSCPPGHLRASTIRRGFAIPSRPTTPPAATRVRRWPRTCPRRANGKKARARPTRLERGSAARGEAGRERSLHVTVW